MLPLSPKCRDVFRRTKKPVPFALVTSRRIPESPQRGRPEAQRSHGSAKRSPSRTKSVPCNRSQPRVPRGPGLRIWCISGFGSRSIAPARVEHRNASKSEGSVSAAPRRTAAGSLRCAPDHCRVRLSLRNSRVMWPHAPEARKPVDVPHIGKARRGGKHPGYRKQTPCP